MSDHTDAEWRETTKKNGWPDPPAGVVETMRWIEYSQDLYAKVDGEWYWSRDGKSPWKHAPTGPRWTAGA